MLDTAAYTPRLLTVYRDEIRAKMKEEFGYKNDMMIPRLDKVVLNIGCGAAAVRDSKKAKSAQEDLTLIAGQKAMTTIAKKSIAGFRVREEMPMGAVTMMRNQLQKPGGTKGFYESEKWAESVDFWQQYAILEKL